MEIKQLSDLKDRIKFVRERLSLSKAEFARQLRVSPAYITMLEKGKSKRISPQLAELIEDKFNINSRWLLTGEGEIFKEKPKKSIHEVIPFHMLFPGIAVVPVLGSVPAGFPEMMQIS